MAKEDGVSNSFGIVSFVSGLISIFLSILIFPPFLFGIVGIIFGIIQLRKEKNWWAIAGLVLSVIGIIVAIVLIKDIASMYGAVQKCTADPTQPGCEQFASALASQAAGAVGTATP